MPAAHFELLVEKAAGNAAALAALSAVALWCGHENSAYPLALQARRLAPNDAAILSQTQAALTSRVQRWHFRIVRDETRNRAFRDAIRRAVTVDTRVLDIGSGTGLLAMMAAKAGARAVISCERIPAVADAAKDVVRLNGFAERITILSAASGELDPEQDLGGKVDVLVSEIVSNTLLSEQVLPTMEDAVGRLLNPGAKVIPRRGEVMVSLAHWAGFPDVLLSSSEGFDFSPFNRLAHIPHKLAVGDPSLSLSSEAVSIFGFDFASGGPFLPEQRCVELRATSRANGIVQWIHLQLDDAITYENRPAAGAESSWAALFTPFEEDRDAQPGDLVRVSGTHDASRIRLWLDR